MYFPKDPTHHIAAIFTNEPQSASQDLITLHMLHFTIAYGSLSFNKCTRQNTGAKRTSCVITNRICSCYIVECQGLSVDVETMATFNFTLRHLYKNKLDHFYITRDSPEQKTVKYILMQCHKLRIVSQYWILQIMQS